MMKMMMMIIMMTMMMMMVVVVAMRMIHPDSIQILNKAKCNDDDDRDD